ncbi:MAG: HIT domain-containing protein [Nanoarchaeota archaeon]|nr:HIT domain-containing protein [Nanoarchaeota archaeon]MBU4116842.1 HIT domain-containing protein [Nanoarchaeota archaeon]
MATLTSEQLQQAKEQIIQQIQSTFPEDKKASAIAQLNSMDEEQLIEFLKQNNLIKEGEPAQQKCIFCSIVEGQIPSYKIDENNSSIAILELNPISKAHTIIIPKQHIPSSNKLPKQAFSLAEKIAQKIKTNLKPKEVKIASSNLFGHEILNILPVYEKETLESPRHKEEETELLKLQKKLEKKSKPKLIKKPKIKKIKEKLWLPKRIP